MTDINERASRDEVLLAFHEAFELPTADQIIEWTEQYPQFAEDIRAHALVSWDWAAQEGVPLEEPDDVTLTNAYSRALSALYEGELACAKAQTASASNDAVAGFHEILAAKGKDIPSLAQEVGGSVGIMRSVIADLFNGVMLPPIAPRISRRIQECLSLNAETFHSALSFALSHPSGLHANATVTPVIRQRRCDEIVRTSGMRVDQIDYWLGID